MTKSCIFAMILWRAPEFSIKLDTFKVRPHSLPITFGSDWIADLHYYQIDIMESDTILHCLILMGIEINCYCSAYRKHKIFELNTAKPCILGFFRDPIELAFTVWSERYGERAHLWSKVPKFSWAWRTLHYKCLQSIFRQTNLFFCWFYTIILMVVQTIL